MPTNTWMQQLLADHQQRAARAAVAGLRAGCTRAELLLRQQLLERRKGAHASKEKRLVAPPRRSELGAGLVESSVCERTGSATFQIAHRSVDREGDLVEPAGINLTKFASNPIWLLEHGRLSNFWSLPIGTARDSRTGHLCVDVGPEKATAVCHFHLGIKEIDEVFSLKPT